MGPRRVRPGRYVPLAVSLSHSDPIQGVPFVPWWCSGIDPSRDIGDRIPHQPSEAEGTWANLEVVFEVDQPSLGNTEHLGELDARDGETG
jgi:hypothetical protein